jgi:hypothetical protein
MTLLNEDGGGGNQGSGGQQNAGGSGGAQGGANGAAQNNGAAAQTSWRDSLPDDLKNDAGLSAFTDVGGLAKSYIETKKLVGKKGVFVPGPNATDEEWNAFFKSAGQPEADKFEVKTPEGKEVNTELVGKFKEWSHKAGLLPRQAQKILDAYMGYEEELMKAQTGSREAANKQALEGLRKEWGQGWDKNVAAAKLFITEHGGQEAMEWQLKTGMGNDPVFLKLAAKAGAMMAGESSLKGDGAGKFGQTPDEIQREISEILGNKDHPIHNVRHPSHQAETRLMEERWKKLYPPTG